MKNRLLKTLQIASERREKIFCAFLTLGNPGLAVTETLIRQFEEAGVDLLELGIPFSDPLADGPTLQKASEEALKKGVCLEQGLQMVARLRRAGSKIPIVCFSYLNPIYRYGLDRFPADAVRAGFDAVLVPDLIPEEEKGFQEACRKQGLATIFLLSPTTGLERARRIGARSQGFVYYVSLRGVTGARKSALRSVAGEIRKYRRLVKKPFLIGFGIGTPDQARAMSRISEGVIVGSAIMDQVRRARGRTAPVMRYVRGMIRAVKGAG